MMIREKQGLVTPLSTGQSRELRHENIFVWDSASELEGAILKVSKGWRMGNNQKFFFFFHIMLLISHLQHSCFTHTPSGCHNLISLSLPEQNS